MGTKHKAYKFRIYPNAEQQELLTKTFGCVRFVYNHYLDVKTNTYKESGKSLSYTKCSTDLVSLKKEKSFLQEVDSIALQQALHHLDAAFQNFFRDKKMGYPKFKSKKQHHYSYKTVCVNNNIRLENGVLTLPKIGNVRIKQHRIIPEGYILKSVTVSQRVTGKYFASVLFAYEVDIQPTELVNIIGLDFSAHDLFVSSEEEIQTDEQIQHYYRKALDKLKKEQLILSRRKKGSKRYDKQRKKIALLHEKIANRRRDYLHKLSRQIANAYDIVCVEDLNMQDLSRTLNIGKSVVNNSKGMFLRFLDYKLTEEGKLLVKIDKCFTRTQTCHVCGHIHEEVSLNTRKWECPVCHMVHDRAQNAAYNIKTEGMRITFA